MPVADAGRILESTRAEWRNKLCLQLNKMRDDQINYSAIVNTRNIFRVEADEQIN
jgi:hypothetical protein